MRRLLQKYNRKRLLFTGTIARTSFFNRNGILQDSVLLKDVKLLDDGFVVADHVWLKNFPPLKKYQEVDTIKFFATVQAYVRGNEGNSVDYGLTNLCRIEHLI